ncbi:hypothetical protein [Dictyobacter vulcani]|uniref:hypothetical protein n=1 Tax=Dictyobacter vulcani TaxID=2607529 RepID=UPI00124FB676|nr:hypothetical protein [Dictyobacter vulcani]
MELGLALTHRNSAHDRNLLRLTQFCQSLSVSQPFPVGSAAPVIYGPAQWAKRSFTGGFPGSVFTLQPDGTLRCPADHPLYAQERRPEHDGSLRVLYAAALASVGLAPCASSVKNILPPKNHAASVPSSWPLPPDPLSAPAVPSLPHVPVVSPSAPLLWRDWASSLCAPSLDPAPTARNSHLFLGSLPSVLTASTSSEADETLLTREQRAHYRLSGSQRPRSQCPPLMLPVSLFFYMPALSASLRNVWPSSSKPSRSLFPVFGQTFQRCWLASPLHRSLSMQALLPSFL